MTEEEQDDIRPFGREPSLPSPLEDPLGFLFGTVGWLLRWLARIDLLLFIAFVGVSAAAVWRLGTRGLVTQEILYVAALLIPTYWGAVMLAKNRLKRRRVKNDDAS